MGGREREGWRDGGREGEREGEREGCKKEGERGVQREESKVVRVQP